MAPPAKEKQAIVDHFRLEGNNYFNHNYFEEAIKSYLKGLQVNDRNPHLHCNIAEAYIRVEKFLEAEEHAIKAITLEGKLTKGYYRAAKAASSYGNRDKAIRHLKEGINKCSDVEQLKNFLALLEQEQSPPPSKRQLQKKSSMANLEDVPGLVSESDSDSEIDSKSRSKSATRVENNKQNQIDKSRSVSVTREEVHIQNQTVSRKKKKSRPIESEDIQNDMFLKTVETELMLMKVKREELNLMMKEGSEALERELARKAAEKFKTALDLVNEEGLENYKLKKLDIVVLKYALCISWIETAIYTDIEKSIEYLKQIETEYSAKFPAVYYGLGKGYWKLNRYKTALDPVERGLATIKKNIQFQAHPWPGTLITIPETSRQALTNALEDLRRTCRAYHVPDASCTYEKCLELSTHIVPSRFIYYSDPDFSGFVTVTCQNKCKVHYHIICWRDYKESISEAMKLQDKEILGRRCPTPDCITDDGSPCVFCLIEVTGSDGNVKNRCVRDEPLKTEGKVKEKDTKKKKKKDKLEESKLQEKNKPKPRPKEKKPPQEIVTKPETSPPPNLEDELRRKLQNLARLRNMNFHITEEIWDPQKKFYGSKDVENLKSFLTSDYISEPKDSQQLRAFVYSYFYEYLREMGPIPMKEIEKKWMEDISVFPPEVNEIISGREGISEFLLMSFRFAALDDIICTAEYIPRAYKMAKITMEEDYLAMLVHPMRRRNIELPLKPQKPHPDLTRDGSKGSIVSEGSSTDNSSTHLVTLSNDDFVKISNHDDDEITYYSDEEDSEEESEDEAGNNLNPDASEFVPSPERGVKNEESDILTVLEGTVQVLHNLGSQEDEFPGQEFVGVKSCLELGNDGTSFSMGGGDSLVNGKTGPDLCIESVGLIQNDLQVWSSDDGTNGIPGILNDPSMTPHFKETSTEYVQTDPYITPESLERDMLKKKLDKAKQESQTKIDSLEKTMTDYIKKINDLEKRNNMLQETKEKEIEKYKVELAKALRDHKNEKSEIQKLMQENAKIKQNMEEAISKITEQLKQEKLKIRDVQESYSAKEVRLELNIEKLRQDILNLKRNYGEQQFDRFIQECVNKIGRMNGTVRLLSEKTKVKKSTMINAVSNWEKALMNASDMRTKFVEQFQNFHGDNVNLFNLEVPEVPAYPPCPLEDLIDELLTENTEATQKQAAPASIPPISQEPIAPPKPDVSLVDFGPKLTQSIFPVSQNPYAFLPTPIGSAVNRIVPPLTSMPSNQLFVGTLPHSFNENDVKPIMHGTHTLNVQPKETKPYKFVPDLGLKPKPVENPAEKKMQPLMSLPSSASASTHSLLSQKDIPKSGPSVPPGFGPKMTETKQKKSSQQKLLAELQRKFPNRSEGELKASVQIVRAKNNGTLTGMTLDSIMGAVEKVLQERSGSKKPGSMGLEKFGVAWGGNRDTTNHTSWSKEEDEKECCICLQRLVGEKTTLACKHAFHTECIRKWLQTESVCPICRVFTTMQDEFPPLS